MKAAKSKATQPSDEVCDSSLGEEDDELDDEDEDKCEDEDMEKLLSKSKMSKQVMLDFQQDHPLSSTHKCALTLENSKTLSKTVLNFMSAPPRRDQEDVLQGAGSIDLQVEYKKMSAAAIQWEKAIKEMKALMLNTNGAVPLHSSEAPPNNNSPVQQLPDKSPHEWRQIVLALHQQIAESRKHHGSAADGACSVVSSQTQDYNYVKVVDKSYLEAAYISKIHHKIMLNCVAKFCLNEEQNRAFTLIANHLVAENSGQLKMYVGGMGGTGKSQVLKALVHLFASWNELHKLLVVAPTASAACLLPGGYQGA
ncbi:ATP-dependent DNA helicase [Salix suchowensis]|nr:ATP-dependent DNA helicase [Salix suchowensis]